MCAHPKSKIVQDLIEKAVDNIFRDYYGNSELDPTGPEMITEYLQETNRTPHGVQYGNVKLCLDNVPLQLFYLQARDENDRLLEKPVALRYKPGASLGKSGLRSLGAMGFDDEPYTLLWHNRNIYN